MTDDVYLCTRGKVLLETKRKVLENCCAAGMKIVFVPTIVKGLNNHQIGDIERAAIENIDAVSGISERVKRCVIPLRHADEKRYPFSTPQLGAV